MLTCFPSDTNLDLPSANNGILHKLVFDMVSLRLKANNEQNAPVYNSLGVVVSNRFFVLEYSQRKSQNVDVLI